MKGGEVVPPPPPPTHPKSFLFLPHGAALTLRCILQVRKLILRGPQPWLPSCPAGLPSRPESTCTQGSNLLCILVNQCSQESALDSSLQLTYDSGFRVFAATVSRRRWVALGRRRPKKKKVTQGLVLFDSSRIGSRSSCLSEHVRGPSTLCTLYAGWLISVIYCHGLPHGRSKVQTPQ